MEKTPVWVITGGQVSYFKKAILSLVRNTNPNDIILGIVDDSGKNLTSLKDWVYETAEDFEIRYIQHECNCGVTFSWNNALANCQDINSPVVLLNDDIILQRNWLSNWLDVLRKSDAGLVGPLTNQPGHQLKQDILNYGSFTQDYVNDPENANDIQRFLDCNQHDLFSVVQFVNGFAFLISQECLIKVGRWFHPENRNYKNEDEFQLRARSVGFKSVIACNSFVYHYKKVTLPSDGRYYGKTLPRMT
jgi:GT2 family glycosyltransferase